MWSSKNVPIRNGWKEIGNPGVIVNFNGEYPFETSFTGSVQIHELYMKSFKANNEEGLTPKAFAVYTYNQEDETFGKYFCVPEKESKNLEIIVVHGIVKE